MVTKSTFYEKVLFVCLTTSLGTKILPLDRSCFKPLANTAKDRTDSDSIYCRVRKYVRDDKEKGGDKGMHDRVLIELRLCT